MQVDDILLTRLTFGVKGSHTKTRDIEGEVWHHPCHNLLSLPPWLKLYVNDYLVREVHDAMKAYCDSLSR